MLEAIDQQTFFLPVMVIVELLVTKFILPLVVRVLN